MTAYRAVIEITDPILDVWVPAAGVPKERPRTTPAEYMIVGGQRVKTREARTYTPKRTRDFEDRLGWLLRRAYRGSPATFPLIAQVEFYATDRRRRDLDNLAKSVFDAGNGIVWVDDSQIQTTVGHRQRVDADPGIRLIVGTGAVMLTRGEET